MHGRRRQGVQLAKAASKYTGRKSDDTTHERIVALRRAGHTIQKAAVLAGCRESQAKQTWAMQDKSWRYRRRIA